MLLLSVVFTVMFFFCPGGTQYHYVPAQVLIPTFNASATHFMHNAGVQSHSINNTEWNRPLLNKTGANLHNHTNANRDLIVGKINYDDHRLFNQVRLCFLLIIIFHI